MAERTGSTGIDRGGQGRDGEDPHTGQEMLYVSWGGTGRAATVREALIRAGAADQGLVYLAVLDDGAFGDIDDTMLDLARDELAWLLDAQLELTRSQTDLADVPVRVLVRAGDVVDRVEEAAEAVDTSEVLVGAPVTIATSAAVTDLVARLRERLTAPVEIIEP